jgi:hypothetical protein
MELGKILYYQILRNAVLIGEIEWAKSYIEKYTHFLKYSYQKSMRALATAYLNFRIKNYNEVLENLKNVRFVDIRDKLNVRNLYIRTFYELNETETVLAQIDSTRKFVLNSKSITDYRKKNFIKSLNLLNKLITAKLNNDKVELEAIRKAAIEDRKLIFGIWLIEKIDELKN